MPSITFPQKCSSKPHEPGNLNGFGLNYLVLTFNGNNKAVHVNNNSFNLALYIYRPDTPSAWNACKP
jgi:hypothetical protein